MSKRRLSPRPPALAAPDPLDEEWRLPQLPPPARSDARNREAWLEVHTARSIMVNQARAWKNSAMAEGWEITRWHAGEHTSQSCVLMKGDYFAVVITRAAAADYRELPQARVTLFKKVTVDDKRLPTGRFYSWAAICDGRAPEVGKRDDDSTPNHSPDEAGRISDRHMNRA